jgi:putative peptidoglycan lipid II flippase
MSTAASSHSNPIKTAPKPPRALKAAMILSALFLLSRLTGLIQSQIIFALLPVDAANAYSVAFTLPDYLSYLVASGTLSLTFIPIFTQFWDRGKEAEAWRFFSTLATILGSALAVLTLVFFFFAEPLIVLTNAGFDDPKNHETAMLAAKMTQILLPAQIFFFLGALMVGALNSFKRFSATGWTGAIYNLVSIAVAVPAYKITGDPLMFAWAILIGAFVGNFLLPAVALFSGPREQRPRFKPNFNINLSSVRRYFQLSIPIMLSFSIATADIWVWKYFASDLGESTLRNMNAAYRLMIAAQGILGQAAAVAAFPFLASKVAAKDFKGLAEFMRTGLRRLIFISLPVSLLLILGAQPLCRLVYGYGHFNDPTALYETSLCFALFVVGLGAWTTQGFVSRGFYALSDTKTPSILGTIICLPIFAPICYFAAKFYGSAGLALATSFAILLYLVIVLILLEKKLITERRVAIGLSKVAGTAIRTVAACIVAGLAGGVVLWLTSKIAAQNKVGDIGILIFVWGITSVVFAFSATKFAIPEWFWLREKLQRRRKATA